VLILGESGVGKELFAQSIHGASERRDRPFVAVNCGALPRELVESELFGYVGGAFSGARREGSPGKFEAADGGTIFLDEIGELPPAAQISLLRVLQEGEITRVGCSQAKPVDVRVIAATNRDLQAALADGSLRRDLYYRLNVLTLELPPLRERREDIPLLARHFLETSSTAMRKGGLTFDAEVINALQGYDWPGNVRELQNVVARLVALASSSRITLADLPASIGASPPSRAPLPAPDSPRQSRRSRRSVSELDVAEERAELLALIKSARTMGEIAAQLGITPEHPLPAAGTPRATAQAYPRPSLRGAGFRPARPLPSRYIPPVRPRRWAVPSLLAAHRLHLSQDLKGLSTAPH
jgi:transcriptional regulator with PAS, ATPase and Fis domain